MRYKFVFVGYGVSFGYFIQMGYLFFFGGGYFGGFGGFFLGVDYILWNWFVIVDRDRLG